MATRSTSRGFHRSIPRPTRSLTPRSSARPSDRAGRHRDLEAPDIARQGALVEAFLPRGEHGLAGCSAQHQVPAFVAQGNVVSIRLPLPCFRLALAGADVRHQSPHPARPAGPAHDLHDSGLGAERDGRSARIASGFTEKPHNLNLQPWSDTACLPSEGQRALKSAKVKPPQVAEWTETQGEMSEIRTFAEV